MAVTSLELVKTAAIAADQKKVEDILVLGLTGLSDAMITLLSAPGGVLVWLTLLLRSSREGHANCGIRPISTEGRDGLNWILLITVQLLFTYSSLEVRFTIVLSDFGQMLLV